MTAATVSPSSAKVKFRLAGGAQPLILLPVSVNNRGPFEFILDPGAGTSLLSSELPKELDVKIAGSKEGHGAGGRIAVSLAKVDSLAVGEMRLENVDVAIVDLISIGTAVGAKIDGDIGYNFLKHFRLTVNYRDSTIRLDDPKRTESFATGVKTEVPIRLANSAKPLILVDVRANGRGPFQFAIDTGTSTSAVTPELAEALGLTTSEISPITAGGGRIQASAATLQSLQLGGAKIDNAAVGVADFFTILNAVVGAKLEGIVGYNFLRNYKVVVDYPRERLTLF